MTVHAAAVHIRDAGGAPQEEVLVVAALRRVAIRQIRVVLAPLDLRRQGLISVAADL